MNKDILRKMGFEKQVERVEFTLCPFCQDAIKIEDFKDEISRKEYGISGLCQKCQDKMFGE